MAEPERPTTSGKVKDARLSQSRRMWRTAGYTTVVAGCLLCMTVGAVFGHYYWSGGTLIRGFMGRNGGRMIVDTFLHGNPLASLTPDQQFPGRSSLNVLILGVDHDYDNRDQIIRTTPGRSDSILLARVDFVNKTIDALTIPRDSAVHIPGRRGISKINAAHEFGGAPLSMETIKSVFGVDTDACVELNFEGFQKVVDSLGGIDVDVQKQLDYDDDWGHLHIHLKPGYQHLNGYNAMGFVRMRHSDSDEMRSKRQHEFLEALRTKIKQEALFGKLPNMLATAKDNLKLNNLTDDQLFALCNFARGLPRENIHVETLPSFEGPSYVSIDAEKSAQVIQRMFFPNQVVALNIDAPDPNSVHSLNSRYDRSGRHRRGSRRHGRASAASQLAAPPPTADLSVEDNPAPEPPATTAPDSGAPATDGPPADSGDKKDGTDDGLKG